MTVELTFERDDEMMRELAAEGPANQPWEPDPVTGDVWSPSDTFGITWPMFPCRLVIDGAIIFDLPRVGVVLIAYELPGTLARAWSGSPSFCPIFEVGTDLHIRREGEMLRLSFDAVAGFASLPELQAVAARFAGEVREYVLLYFPELAEDRFWGEWLRTGRDPEQFNTTAPSAP